MRNHTGLIAVATILAPFAVAGVSLAETEDAKQAKIDRAASAAPDSISNNAEIVDADGTVLRSGSNGWHCFPGRRPRLDAPDVRRRGLDGLHSGPW